MGEEHLDGCEVDFTKKPTADDELEELLVAKGEEEDEDDG